MTTRRPLGTQVTPGETLLQAAQALVPPFEVAASGPYRVELHDPAGDLPDTTLRLGKERRLFSRTFALLVEASSVGHGPGEDAGVTAKRSGWRRGRVLEPHPSTPASREWAERLERAGLLDGIRTMTNVVTLEAAWDAADRTARLRLVTLAGALVGTSPTTSMAIPLEPDDVEGLLGALRAVRAAVMP